ncbi:MAG: heme-binding domain-containing protein [Pyrinomonadaceae bacterium]|nr:heme-binding domain-containing protein [Pyrinomonadaceae bacterium]
MKRALKVLKWAALVVVVVLVGLQFVRPARTNPAVDQSQTIHARQQVNPQVAAILDRSCQDCHSNTTRWPWYSNVAPVSWFVIDHVNHARSHMNLSEWGSLDNRKASKKLEEICEEVQDGEMPLESYTYIHWSAKLSLDDVKTLCEWTTAERARIASR